MIDHPNALLVHHCLQAANAGDRQTLEALWADDIVWHVKGDGLWQGELKGADAIFEFLASVGDVAPMGCFTEIEDVLISHERAAVLCRARADWSDRSLDARVLVITTIEDRRIREVVTVPIDPERTEAFWAG